MIPAYQALYRPILAAAAKSEVRIADAIETIATQLELNADDRMTMLPSGKQTVFANRIHWATTYLSKAGLLSRTRRAHILTTDQGRAVLQENSGAITNAELDHSEDFRRFRTRTATDRADASAPPPKSDLLSLSEQTPDDVIRTAHNQIEASLADDLLERIGKAPPDFFERLIVRLLRAMGYGGSEETAIRALGRSGDDGVDGVIDQDALGLDRVYIQAKRYAPSNNIGPGAIRDFFGSLDHHKANKGLFVTTSDFSKSARNTAEKLSKRIVLIDGAVLTSLMIRHNVGCRVTETWHVRRVDEDFFDAG